MAVVRQLKRKARSGDPLGLAWRFRPRSTEGAPAGQTDRPRRRAPRADPQPEGGERHQPCAALPTLRANHVGSCGAIASSLKAPGGVSVSRLRGHPRPSPAHAKLRLALPRQPADAPWQAANEAHGEARRPACQGSRRAAVAPARGTRPAGVVVNHRRCIVVSGFHDRM